MRKILVLLVAAVVTLGLTVPAFAQATPPPAPAPKVTINGLVDFVTGYYKNSTGDAGPGGARDITNDNDEGWYSRERGVFTLTGEIGRAKGVVALEIDFHNGRTLNAPAGFGGNTGLDIETDEKGQIEVKWLYLEAPITGPGSMLPFIPMPTLGRFGGQPARGHDYKPGMHLSGDIPAATLETMWGPNVRTTFTYVQMDEALDPNTNAGGKENFAVVGSLEWQLFKGFTIKPLASYARYENGSPGDGLFARGGFNPNAAGQGTGENTKKYTVGGDVRWTTGPFSLQPTFLYQFGTQEVAAGVGPVSEVDINSWIIDVIAGFRSGPLTIEVRGAWTPGMDATECVQAIAGVCAGGDDIKYYEPITTGSTGYWAGWSEIQSSGVDYNVSLRPVSSGTQLGRSPSYDKYGRLILGAALDYALTPALTFHLVTNVQWTDKKVDTQSTAVSGTQAGTLIPVSGGDENYLGNEWNVGFTYRFAPSVVLDVIGAWLIAGDALNHGGSAASTTNTQSAEDAYKVAARVRVTW